LGQALRRHQALRVHIQRDSAVRVTQALLHNLYVFAIRFQQSCERISERVPADVFENAGTHRGGPNSLRNALSGQYGCRPNFSGLANTQSSSWL
jgi:hypothetical protein